MVGAVAGLRHITQAISVARGSHLIDTSVNVADPAIFLVEQFGQPRPHRGGDARASPTATHSGSTAIVGRDVVTRIVGARSESYVRHVTLAVGRSVRSLKGRLRKDRALAAARRSRGIIPDAFAHRSGIIARAIIRRHELATADGSDVSISRHLIDILGSSDRAGRR